MKNHYLKSTFILFFVINAAFSQVGIGNADPKSTLDITAVNPTGTTTNVDGITIPRVSRERAQSMTTIPTSTMIYIDEVTTGSATGTTVNVTAVGFYFFNGTAWEKITTGAITPGWSLTGNASTTPGTNFIGTTGTEDIRIKTDGTDRWNISNTNSGQLQSYSLGSASAPTYSFQPNSSTGLFSSGSDALDFSTGGTARFRIPNGNQLQSLSSGTAAAPSYSFSSDTGVGMWSSGTNILSLSTSGVERIRIDAAGKVAIGAANPGATLDVIAKNATGTSTNVDGVSIPNVNLQRAQSMTSIPTSTMIYVNDLSVGAATGITANITAVGLYYWDGTVWQSVKSSKSQTVINQYTLVTLSNANYAANMGNGGYYYGAGYVPATTAMAKSTIMGSGDGMFFTPVATTLTNMQLTGWLAMPTGTAGSATIHIVKYSLGTASGSMVGTVTGTSLNSQSVTITANTMYPISISVPSTAMLAGDVLVCVLVNTTGGSRTLSFGGQLQFTN